MTFDDERTRPGMNDATGDGEQEEKRRARARGAGRPATTAGAAGAGAGVGAGLGAVAGDEIVERLDESDSAVEDEDVVSRSGQQIIRDRIAEAEAALQAVTLDVFEGDAPGLELPDAVRDAAGITGGVPRATSPDRTDHGDDVAGAGQALLDRPGVSQSGAPPDRTLPQPGIPGSDAEASIPIPLEPLVAPPLPGTPDAPSIPDPPAFAAPPDESPLGTPGTAPDAPAAVAPTLPDGPSAPDFPDTPESPGGADADSPAGVLDAPPSESEGSSAPEAPAEPGEPPESDTPDSPPAGSGSDTPDAAGSPPPASSPESPPEDDSPHAAGPDRQPGYDQPPSGDHGWQPGHDVTYPYVTDWHAEEGWARIAVQTDHGQIMHFQYFTDGRVYYIDDHGNTYPVDGDHLPDLLYVATDGTAYFARQHGVDMAYFAIDTDGGIEWVDYEDIPGYRDNEAVGEYEYPRTIAWDSDEGWVILHEEHGGYVKYFVDGTAHQTDEHGNEVVENGIAPIGQLLHVDAYGTAYFRSGVEGEYTYFLVDHDGGIEHIDPGDIPGYEYDERVEDEYEYEGTLPEGAPAYFEFGDRQYGNPLVQNYELASYDPNTGAYTYRYWDEAEGDYNYVQVVYDGAGMYRVTYLDPDDPAPEVVFNVRYENGLYVGYQAVGGAYYDEYSGQPETPGAEGIRYFLPGYGDGYPHPDDVYDEPTSTDASDWETYYTYGDAPNGAGVILTRFPDGSESIGWYTEDGKPSLTLTVNADGSVDYHFYPIDYTLEHFNRIVDVTIEGYEHYPDPDETGMAFEQALSDDGLRIVRTYEDGTIKHIYRDGNGTIAIEYPDNTFIWISGDGSQTLGREGDGTYQPPVSDDQSPEGEQDEATAPDQQPAESQEGQAEEQPDEEPAVPSTPVFIANAPLVTEWNPGFEGGWVRILHVDGNVYEYHVGQDTHYRVTDGGLVATDDFAMHDLQYVDPAGVAYFKQGESAYYTVSTSGGVTPVDHADLPYVEAGEDPVFQVVEPEEPDGVSVPAEPEPPDPIEAAGAVAAGTVGAIADAVTAFNELIGLGPLDPPSVDDVEWPEEDDDDSAEP